MKAKSVVMILMLMGLLLMSSMPTAACEPPPGGDCQTVLKAGQHYDAGAVTVSDDGTNLTITYQTDGGWTLGETHLYVGTTPPTKAAPGKFPYRDQTQYVIPLEDLELEGECDDLYIAAHAVVYNGEQEETAWADSYGVPIRENKGWAMYIGYNLCNGCFKP